MINEESLEMFQKIIKSDEINKLSVYSHNILKIANSKASMEEYFYLLDTNEILGYTIGIFSFELPEYLCVEGKEVEIYEIKEEDTTTFVRLNQRFHNAVYSGKNNDFVEIMGRANDIKEYKDNNISNYQNYRNYPIKTVFQVALFIPNIGDEVKNTVIRRSLIRRSIRILNKFSDCYRHINNLYGISEPHYSYNSFDCAYIKEYDFKGSLISSDKYLLNASKIYSGSLPMFIDNDGNVINKFRELLKTEKVISEFPSLIFKKGNAYYGRGHDIAAIKFCVSAVEAILKKWAVESETQGKIVFKKEVTKLTIKELKGKFHEVICFKKLVENPNDFMSELNDAIDLRHSIEHRNNYEVDSLKIQGRLEILRKYFDLVEKEYNYLTNETE